MSGVGDETGAHDPAELGLEPLQSGTQGNGVVRIYGLVGLGRLYVTWAPVEAAKCEGVESYLAN